MHAANMTNTTAALHTNSKSSLVGWTPESGGRGTLKLISTCLFTIFFCTWVVIHPRVHSRQVFHVPHKMALCLKTVIAPELIAVEGAQEWIQARRIVNNCAKSTDNGLTLVQAFYVGMLGLRYRSTDGLKVLWPNQLEWLLQEGLFDWQLHHESWGLELEDIKDRSNADGTAKLFALVQVAWFVAQSIMRVAHNLPLAPLESMTLSYIPLFALTYFFWWVKPKDIAKASIVHLPTMTENQLQEFQSMSISDDFDETRQQRSFWSIWYLTPRTFEFEDQDKREPEYEIPADKIHSSKLLTKNSLDSIPTIKILPLSQSKKEKVLAHWDPTIYHSRTWPLTCLFGISFPALHLLSWNSTFPTQIELYLWRSAGIASIVSMLIFMQFEKVSVNWRDPLIMLVKISAPGIYLISRAVMLAGAIVAFRASDAKIYETFVVSNYWLHLV